MELKDYLFDEYRRNNNKSLVTAKDYIKSQNLGFLTAPKLKGEVDIILKDDMTGKVKEHVHDENLVTNALADIFASNWGGQLDYTKIMPIIPNLMGGVLCFQNGLGNDATSYGAPCDNPVTAHAGNESPASVLADLTRGAPNDSESYRTEHGFRQCWDWTASQGIGQISAVALTHKNTGNWWIYDTEGRLQPVVRADNGTKGYYYGTGGSANDYDENAKLAPTLYNPTTKMVYSFQQTITNNVSTLTVNKWLQPMQTDITLMSDGLQGERSVNKTEAVIELGTITSSNNYKKGRNLCFVRPDWEHDRIYLYFVTQIRSDSANYGSRVEYGTLDADTLAYTYGGQIIQASGGLENRYNPFFLTDPNAIRPIDYDDNGNLFIVVSNYHYANIPRTGNASLVETDISAIYADLMSTQGDFTVMSKFMTWGTGEGQIIPITPLSESVNLGEGRRTIGGLPKTPVGFMSSTFANRTAKLPLIGCYLNTMYLATKFNLQEPVEKLGNQSMQVIYTLTEV